MSEIEMVPEFRKEIVKGHCPSCGPNRFADVRGEYGTSVTDEEACVWINTDYRILECRGCETVYFQIDEVFSENADHFVNASGEWETHIPHQLSHWPEPSENAAPHWQEDLEIFDADLGSLFSDIHRCLAAKLLIPTAIAARTAFDRSTSLLGVDEALTFAEKLDELQTLGRISQTEKDTLAILIDAGNAAAHRGWKPKLAEVRTLVSIVEAFLYRTFILGQEAEALKSSVPAKQKRK